MEELLAQHRKELKALDGEKRAAIKKAKATKGKKAKDEIAGYVLLICVEMDCGLHSLGHFPTNIAEWKANTR